IGNNALYNLLHELGIINIEDQYDINHQTFFDHTIEYLHILRCTDKDDRSETFHEELLIYSTLSAFLLSKMQGNLSRAICSLRQEVLKKIL
ncbi:MAG TPA: hypothetical protein DCL21_00665, partial [Alphaproteobacteria bacterium]|nr:hypothetical protein [Alphaproteobacteria bacterium]